LKRFPDRERLLFWTVISSWPTAGSLAIVEIAVSLKCIGAKKMRRALGVEAFSASAITTLIHSPFLKYLANLA
jgi:hypothetical protein